MRRRRDKCAAETWLDSADAANDGRASSRFQRMQMSGDLHGSACSKRDVLSPLGHDHVIQNPDLCAAADYAQKAGEPGMITRILSGLPLHNGTRPAGWL